VGRPPERALTDLTDAQIEAEVVAAGGMPFQARQVSHWVFRHRVREWDQMHNVPRALRESLAARLPIRSSTIAKRELSQDGTEKLLVQLHDGEAVECVVIPEGERTTLCVSTQVGCPVGCVFCASGLNGVKRNLSAGEIVEQVLLAEEILPQGRQLTNLVVMGMGEPLLNLPALLPALERIHDPAGLNLGARRITVSTSGYPERMRELAKAEPAYNLAVSLHAADDTKRKQLVPTARSPVAEIVAAARDYFVQKGREVTFEVVLLAGENDRPSDADALARALSGFPCTVNLIPWNPVPDITGLARPKDRAVDDFAESLRELGLKVTVRRQRGADRSAACGQLRLRESKAASG